MLAEEIETKRLKLRPLSFDDVGAVFAFAADPDWGRYELVPSPYTHATAEQFVARAILADRAVRPSWAVSLDGEMIGSVSFGSESDWKIAALGYGLNKAYWGKGLAAEAVSAVLRQAFAGYEQLRRIRAHTDSRNSRSIGLLRRLGFTQEGTLRANQLNKGEFVDEAIFGLLREEWTR